MAPSLKPNKPAGTMLFALLDFFSFSKEPIAPAVSEAFIGPSALSRLGGVGIPNSVSVYAAIDYDSVLWSWWMRCAKLSKLAVFVA